jgi:hypothetical protein
MNNKIITSALKGITANPELLAKIISYVPNPEVAVEMLLGIFEEPAPGALFYRPKWNSEITVKVITSIDHLGDSITYNTFTRKMQRVFYVNKGDKANGIYVIDRPSTYDDYGDVQVNGFTVTEGIVVSAKEFYKDNVVITAKEFQDQIDTWEMWGITLPEDMDLVLPF